ncbi:septum formation initiator family protein [Chitinispirillales bacterium ANBcel5]|uniref:FtsB family cell division protein n=1 Tax=Cellulosispirillum alkaliphilum TaxID=3039283 RepID=UPI002A4E9D81|nr:septum formation initiator family protein [Chitinispirillales bacterium ANBcel5]
MKKKNIVILIVCLVVLSLISALVFGNQGLIDVYRTHLEIKRRSEQISEAIESLDSLKEVRDKLVSDTAYIERVAREKLGMSAEDEKIYKFVED